MSFEESTRQKRRQEFIEYVDSNYRHRKQRRAVSEEILARHPVLNAANPKPRISETARDHFLASNTMEKAGESKEIEYEEKATIMAYLHDPPALHPRRYATLMNDII